jgi:glycosyltransferase involved in cell wall biosynthesis
MLAGECARPRREGRVLALGFVDRLAPLLSAADVAVNPIQSGSGSNLKLAEYVAAGLPVITTPIGLRGYEAFARLVTVAELEEFAHVLQREPRVVGRMPEVADLGWRALARRLYDIYGALMDRRPPARSSY